MAASFKNFKEWIASVSALTSMSNIVDVNGDYEVIIDGYVMGYWDRSINHGIICNELLEHDYV